MTFRVVIEAEAEREFREAVNFYDEREPGVGQRFAKELQAFFNAICQDPERFPFASRLTQKHGSRNPAELRRRLK